jgi:hypothetical protein
LNDPEIEKPQNEESKKELSAPVDEKTASVDIQTDEILEEPVVLHKDPKFKADIAISSQVGGFCGPLQDSPLAEMHQWQSEDGNPLIDSTQADHEKTLLMEFWLFNTDAPFKNRTVYLPVELFEGKNEGDVIYFKYEGDLVELTINQITRSATISDYESEPSMPDDDDEPIDFDKIISVEEKLDKLRFENMFTGIKNKIFNDTRKNFIYGADILSAEKIRKPVDSYMLGDRGSLYVAALDASKDQWRVLEKDPKEFREAIMEPEEVQFSIRAFIHLT